MMTDPWKVDPRLDRDPRGQAPRLVRPAERLPTCSCGCRSLHEVARRRLVDGGVLVVLSDGCFRLFAPGCIGVDVEVWLDRWSAPARRLLAWATTMDCVHVRVELGVA